MPMSIWIQFSKPIDEWCEVESLSTAATLRPLAGGAVRKAQASDVSLYKRSDELSSKLWLHTAKGTKFASVTIEFYKKPGDVLFMSYVLKDVLITSLTSSGGDVGPMESITLSAGSITSQYFKTDG